MALSVAFEELLMVKFYVVDGVSYLACETAIGLFGHHGYQAMKVCRHLGFQDSAAKKSLTLSEFQELLNKKRSHLNSAAIADGLNVSPIEYYLRHRGFGVTASASEINMARFYLVDGLSYLSAEERAGLRRKRGFEAMYSVCKLGGFHGAAERGSMSSSDFEERMSLLGFD